MKFWKPVIIVLGIIPFGFITSLLAFYFHAGHILGHRPIANSNDPQQFSIYNLYQPFVDFTANTWFFSFIAWVLVVGLNLFLKRHQISWRLFAFSLLGQGLAIILFFSKIMAWYAD